MNKKGVFAGAYITDQLGKSSDAGNLGKDFAMLAGIVLVALIIQLSFLRPKFNDLVDVYKLAVYVLRALPDENPKGVYPN